MSLEQEKYVESLGLTPEDTIYIRETGREVVDLPPHRHPYHQIIHTLTGTLHIRIGDEVFFVPERHLAWIPGNTIHELSSNNRSISLHIFHCIIPTRPNERFGVVNTNRFLAVNLDFLVKQRNVIRRSDEPHLYDFAINFLNLIPEAGEEYKTPLKTLMEPDDIRVRNALEFIREHLTDNIGMEDVADNVGVSVRTLSRLFRNSDISFSAYLNYQRITRAIELYADRDKTMQEIAYDVGFNTPNHFNRVFRQILGTNPGNFFNRH